MRNRWVWESVLPALLLPPADRVDGAATARAAAGAVIAAGSGSGGIGRGRGTTSMSRRAGG